MLPLAVRLAAIPIALAVAIAVRPDVAITGRITDAQSNAGIEGARVIVTGTSIATVSNADGRFRLAIPDSLRGTTLAVQARRPSLATTLPRR